MKRLATSILALMFGLTATASVAAEAVDKNARTAATPKKVDAQAKKSRALAAKKAAVPAVTLVPEAPKPVSTSSATDIGDAAGSAYLQGQALEQVNRRLALGAYREAARQGYGPAQKRLWELLKDVPGNESLASVYQIAAWSQKVPGVPAPLSPLRFN